MKEVEAHFFVFVAAVVDIDLLHLLRHLLLAGIELAWVEEACWSGVDFVELACF